MNRILPLLLCLLLAGCATKHPAQSPVSQAKSLAAAKAQAAAKASLDTALAKVPASQKVVITVLYTNAAGCKVESVALRPPIIITNCATKVSGFTNVFPASLSPTNLWCLQTCTDLRRPNWTTVAICPQGWANRHAHQLAAVLALVADGCGYHPHWEYMEPGCQMTKDFDLRLDVLNVVREGERINREDIASICGCSGAYISKIEKAALLKVREHIGRFITKQKG